MSMDAARPTEKPNKLMDVPSLFLRKLRKAILKNVFIMLKQIFSSNDLQLFGKTWLWYINRCIEYPLGYRGFINGELPFRKSYLSDEW